MIQKKIDLTLINMINSTNSEWKLQMLQDSLRAALTAVQNKRFKLRQDAFKAAKGDGYVFPFPSSR